MKYLILITLSFFSNESVSMVVCENGFVEYNASYKEISKKCDLEKLGSHNGKFTIEED